MELRHIRYFLAIAEEQNFTRAAAKVGIGQPPLSQQIKDLETEVGARLFHRLAHGVELTEAGRAFLEIVQCMPSQANKAALAAQRASRGEIGSLRVGFTDSAIFDHLVPETIRAFRRAYPSVLLSIEEAPSTLLVKALRDGNLDAIFLRPEGDAKVDGLQVRVAVKEPFVAVLPSAHKAAVLAKVALKHLRDDPFVLFHRSIGPMHDIVKAACEKAGFEPILGPAALQAGSILTYVAAEFGVALVPSSMRRSQMDGVVFRELAGVAPTTALAIASRRGDLSKAVRNFVAIVV